MTPAPRIATRSGNQAEILRALQVMAEPGQVVELRALDVSEPSYRAPHTVSGYFDDAEALARAAVSIAPHTRGTYITLNPVVPSLLARAANRVRAVGSKDSLTSDKDIVARRRLLIDTDAERPAGISATDAKHSAALERCREIKEYLSATSWPDPISGDSANGGHLIYAIDLPVDDGGLVQTVLAGLAFKFDDDKIHIDQTVFNPARLSKLYGTTPQKGDNTADRPHRMARLLHVPPKLEVVSRKQLEAVAAWLPKATANKQPPNHSANGKPFDLDRWMAEHFHDALGPFEWQKGRRWKLPVCPWDSSHTNLSAYVVQLESGAIAAGCHHNGCAGNDWRALRDRLEPGWSEQKRKVIPQSSSNGHEPTKANQSTPQEKSRKSQPAKKSEKYLTALTELGYTFRINELDDSLEVNSQPITDPLRAQIRVALRDRGFRAVNAAEDAYLSEGLRNAYHPVRDYLNGLRYTGGDPIGALSCKLTDTYGNFVNWLPRFLVGAVRKVMEPGAQNPMLVLEGPQDIGKSFWVRWLCPLPEYFVELRIDPDDKDAYVRLARTFVWEAAELGSTTRRADREALKHFLSLREVVVRKAYGRYDIRKPALASFIGTVNNESGFLSDPTGSRRFLISRITQIDWSYTEMDPAQVWAQAVTLYRDRGLAALTAVEKQEAEKVADAYEVDDPIEGLLLTYFELEPDVEANFMATSEILSFLEDKGLHNAQTKSCSMSLAATATRYDLRRGRDTLRRRGYYGVVPRRPATGRPQE